MTAQSNRPPFSWARPLPSAQTVEAGTCALEVVALALTLNSCRRDARVRPAISAGPIIVRSVALTSCGSVAPTGGTEETITIGPTAPVSRPGVDNVPLGYGPNEPRWQACTKVGPRPCRPGFAPPGVRPSGVTAL
jgi:hypothetical protein